MFHATRRRFLFFMTLWGCLLMLLSAQTLMADNTDNETDFVTHEYVLEVFVRDGCPHCTKAKEFLS